MSAGKLERVTLGRDSIVIRHYVAGLQGGKTLDTSGFAPDHIRAGHVVIRDTASGAYKPMPLDGDGAAYASLPAGHEYVGVVVATVPADRPQAAVMYDGEVNDLAAPYSYDGIKEALRAAVPTLHFAHD